MSIPIGWNVPPGVVNVGVHGFGHGLLGSFEAGYDAAGRIIAIGPYAGSDLGLHLATPDDLISYGLDPVLNPYGITTGITDAMRSQAVANYAATPPMAPSAETATQTPSWLLPAVVVAALALFRRN